MRKSRAKRQPTRNDVCLLQEGLLAALNCSLGGAFSDCLASVDTETRKRTAEIWVTPKKEMSPRFIAKAERIAAGYLSLVDFHLGSFNLTVLHSLPATIPTILRCVKVTEPVSAERLKGELKKLGFSVKPPPWLAHQLDNLRQRKLLIRNNRKCYSLTWLGLQSVPVARGRHSSDVARALALARKKW